MSEITTTEKKATRKWQPEKSTTKNGPVEKRQDKVIVRKKPQRYFRQQKKMATRKWATEKWAADEQ